MLFLLLFTDAKSTDVLSLIPPFEPDLYNNIGYWTFSEKAQIFTDHIILNPPVQFKIGSVYATVPIEYNKYCVAFIFSITKVEKGGYFMVSLSDEFGSSYLVEKGRAYRGIGLLCKVMGDDYNDTKIKLLFKLINNKDIVSISDTSDNIFSENNQDFEKEYILGSDLEISLNISGNNVLFNIDNREFKSFYKESGKNIRDCFLSIQSLNNKFYNDFNVRKVVITPYSSGSIGAEKSKHGVNMEQVFNQESSTYRNPKFNKISEAKESLDKDTKIKPDKLNVLDVLEAIDELNYATTDTISYSELDHFISSKIIPYATKWHKRLIKHTDSFRSIRESIYDSMNQSKELISSFEKSLKRNLRKTNLRILELNDLLLNQDPLIPMSEANSNVTNASLVLTVNIVAEDFFFEKILLATFAAEMILLLIFTVVKGLKKK